MDLSRTAGVHIVAWAPAHVPGRGVVGRGLVTAGMSQGARPHRNLFALFLLTDIISGNRAAQAHSFDSGGSACAASTVPAAIRIAGFAPHRNLETR